MNKFLIGLFLISSFCTYTEGVFMDSVLLLGGWGCSRPHVERRSELFKGKGLDGKLHDHSVLFVDSLHGVLAGEIWNEEAGWWTTSDGGKSWGNFSPVGKADEIFRIFLYYKEGVVYSVVTFLNKDTSVVYCSPDLGKTWKHEFVSPELDWVNCFYVRDSLNLFRKLKDSSHRSYWQYSRDGGETWRLCSLLNKPSGNSFFLNDSIVAWYWCDRGSALINGVSTRNINTGEYRKYDFPKGFCLPLFCGNFILVSSEEDELELFRWEQGHLIRHGTFGAKKKERSKYFFHDGTRFCIGTFRVHGIASSTHFLYMSSDGGQTWQREELSYYPLNMAVNTQPEGMTVWIYSKIGTEPVFGVYKY